MRGWLKFWRRSVRAAFGFGWVAFGVVTTASPSLIALIQRHYPTIVAQAEWVNWISENQNEIDLTIFGTCILIYLAYAPYKLYAQLNTKLQAIETQRPDFVYSPEGSVISKSTQINAGSGTRILRTDYFLRFANRGNAKAYNPTSQIFGCWINDDPPRTFATSKGDSVGSTAAGDYLHRKVWTSHPATTNGEPPITDRDLVVFLVEIESHPNAIDAVAYKNEPIWLCWYWSLADRLAFPHPSEVAIAERHINDFRAG